VKRARVAGLEICEQGTINKELFCWTMVGNITQKYIVGKPEQ
jgi:hypothetical protein